MLSLAKHFKRAKNVDKQLANKKKKNNSLSRILGQPRGNDS